MTSPILHISDHMDRHAPGWRYGADLHVAHLIPELDGIGPWWVENLPQPGVLLIDGREFYSAAFK